jgi:hydroxymethylglutaryl-CoA lyase
MLKNAVEFTRRWLEIGASDIEHADHSEGPGRLG